MIFEKNNEDSNLVTMATEHFVFREPWRLHRFEILGSYEVREIISGQINVGYHGNQMIKIISP